jgi:hypothetical protein
MTFDTLIRFRVDGATKTVLQRLARKNGISLSETLRYLTSRDRSIGRREIDVQFLHHLGRLDINLDRIARVLNAREFHDRSVPLDFLLTLRAEIDELRVLVERLEKEIVG